MNASIFFRVILCLLIFTTEFSHANNYDDPTAEELALSNWAMGVRVSFCVEMPISEIAILFQQAMASLVTNYCNYNASACLLIQSAKFSSEQVHFLNGFPKREFGVVNIRFIVILPHAVVPSTKFTKPLLSKQILSDILKKNLSVLEANLNWEILSFEKLPKYDSITEFMNMALIPIAILVFVLMVALASWSSTLSSSTFGNDGGWTVSGSSSSTSGKNTAQRRIQEIIAAERKYSEMKNIQMPTINLDGDTLESDEGLVPTLDYKEIQTPLLSQQQHQQQHLHLQRHYAPSRKILSRKQNSIEEVMGKRVRKVARKGQDAGGERQWKSSSMMLRVFGRNARVDCRL